MRIAMLSVHSSPLARLGGKEAGGMNVYIRELSRELGRRGLAVDVFTRAQDATTPPIVALDRGVRVISLRAGPAAPYDKNLLLDYLPEFINRVRCFAESEDLHYDVLHSHYWISGQVARALRQAWGAPIVHMFHTLGSMKNEVARSDDERETGGRTAIERDLLQSVDAVTAATPLDRAQMVWHYGADAARIRVIPAGVDLQRFQPRDRDAARAALGLPAAPHRLVVLVGRIEPLKGIDALIEASAQLLAARPALRGHYTALVVGGEPEDATERWNAEQRRLGALRDALGLGDAVVFAGARTHEELPLYYAAADIVTMPSHYESFGMAALEGLASGRPVVATDAGGPAFIVEDGISGLLTPPAAPNRLAGQLGRILDDDALAALLAAGARQRARRFGWPTIGCEIMQVYRDVLHGARPAVAV